MPKVSSTEYTHLDHASPLEVANTLPDLKMLRVVLLKDKGIFSIMLGVVGCVTIPILQSVAVDSRAALRAPMDQKGKGNTK